MTACPGIECPCDYGYCQDSRIQAPSGAQNDYGCDPAQSAGANLGPNSDKLLGNIDTYRNSMSAFDLVGGYTMTPQQVATDAVTASGSGLDPAISVLNAE